MRDHSEGLFIMAALPLDLPGLVLISLPSSQALEEHIWQARLLGDQHLEMAAVEAEQLSHSWVSSPVFPGAVDETGSMPFYAEECASMLAVTFSGGDKMMRSIVSTCVPCALLATLGTARTWHHPV